eukprot:UN31569
MRARNFILKTPLKLEEIHLTDPTIVDKEWTLDLPTLKTLTTKNHTPPPKKFAKSIINCPNIETYFSHKFWPLEKIPKLYFPNCKNFTYRRGDSVEELAVYLPKATYINVDECYELDSFNLLKKGHDKHKEYNIPVDKHTKFTFSAINAEMARPVHRSLIRSGRLLK